MSPPAVINLISASLSPRIAANHSFDDIIVLFERQDQSSQKVQYHGSFTFVFLLTSPLNGVMGRSTSVTISKDMIYSYDCIARSTLITAVEIVGERRSREVLQGSLQAAHRG